MNKLPLADRLEALYESLLEDNYHPKLSVKHTKVTLVMTAKNYKEALGVVNLVWKIKQKYEK